MDPRYHHMDLVGHFESIKERFIQNLIGKRWTGFPIHQLVVTTLEVGKLVAKVNQLAIIFIEILVSQMSPLQLTLFWKNQGSR